MKRGLRDKSFDSYLHEQLRDPEFAVNFINDAVQSENVEEILLAIRELLRARGMFTKISRKKGLPGRVSLYKAFSNRGNPLFATVYNTLDELGIGLKPYLKQA